MIITNLNRNNWGLEVLMTRREKELRSTGTCKLLRDKRVGGRGYNWSKVQTCRSQRRQIDYSQGMLCLNSNCQIWACVVKYRRETSVGSSNKKRLLANINLYFVLKSHNEPS